METFAAAVRATSPTDNVMRTGVVRAIDVTAGRVDVMIGGSLVTGLSYLAGIPPLAVGDVVAILRQEAIWLVLGKISPTVFSLPWVTMPNPSWLSLTGTNPSIGDGTLTVQYRPTYPGSNRYEVRMLLIGGAATNWGTGVYSWGLPFTITADSASMDVGAGHILNVGVQEYSAIVKSSSSGAMRMFWSGGGGTGGSVSATSPYTFSGVPSGDTIHFLVTVDRLV